MERVAEIKERMQETLIEIRELAVLSGPPVYEAVAVVELVRRVISNSRAFLEAHAVTCSIVQKTGRCEIWADHERLTSAITNLLKNGVEAMPDGGQMTITIDQTDGGLVRMIVEDTGIGIEADELPSLFELGRSTKPGGSGVGLAAVARALSGMGAEISVESSLGIGTRFTIVFPQTTIVCAPHSRPLPIPNDRQTRMTQQALRAAAAMYASGDFKMTVHLWCKALIGQIEPPLRRALPPVRARHLLGSVTMSTKRSQQLSQDHRLRLQAILGGSSKQLVKKSDTVIGALIHGDWDRLTHPLHWAILLQILVGKDAYPWPDEDCREMARWLASADQFDELETLDDDRLAGLGTGLCTLLDLALPGHLGA
ncbi:MAG: ATP-binding protein [Bacillota bacterium]